MYIPKSNRLEILQLFSFLALVFCINALALLLIVMTFILYPPLTLPILGIIIAQSLYEKATISNSTRNSILLASVGGFLAYSALLLIPGLLPLIAVGGFAPLALVAGAIGLGPMMIFATLIAAVVLATGFKLFNALTASARISSMDELSNAQIDSSTSMVRELSRYDFTVRKKQPTNPGSNSPVESFSYLSLPRSSSTCSSQVDAEESATEFTTDVMFDSPRSK